MYLELMTQEKAATRQQSQRTTRGLCWTTGRNEAQGKQDSATIEFINTGNNQFQICSVFSGLYLAKRRNRGKFVKLRGTYNENGAMVFSEHVTDDNLNEYTSKVDNKRLC